MDVSNSNAGSAFGLLPAVLVGALRIDIEEAIPSHCGLGSGTQIALATAAAFCALFGLTASVPELARGLERGARSGIGSGVGGTMAGVVLQKDD